MQQALQILNRLEKSEFPEPIDVDSLLEEIRGAYNKVYQLGWDENSDELEKQSVLEVVHNGESNPDVNVAIPSNLETYSEQNEVFNATESDFSQLQSVQNDEIIEVQSNKEPEGWVEEKMNQNGLISVDTDLVELEKEADLLIRELSDVTFEEEKTTEYFIEEELVITTENSPKMEVPSTKTTVDFSSDEIGLKKSPDNFENFSESSTLFDEIEVEAKAVAQPENLVSKKELSADFGSELPTIKLDANHPPISDLRSALSINDKFSLANKLFNGNGTAFNLSLNVLNGFDNLSDARGYLTTLKQQNNWEIESPEFVLLCELVERRYFRS